MPRFSIITPVHLWNDQRVESFLQTIKSVKNQIFQDFEWVILDDGSTMPFRWEMLNEEFPKGKVNIIHRQHEERVISYNEAFKAAKGKWFTLLDSDDEYTPSALAYLDKAIIKYPQEKMFNFGSAHAHADGNFTFRDPFMPKRRKIGHVGFNGGNIVNGTFIFHRSIYDDLGAFPDARLENVDTTKINYGGVRDLYMGSPYDFSAAAQLEFPAIRKYFMVNHEDEPGKILKELGNPWGQDYYLFYKYTRKYHSKVLKGQYLYIVHPR